MAGLPQDIVDGMNYFAPGTLKRFGPAAAPGLEEAERELSVKFPPSLRNFLLVQNGLALEERRIFSVSDSGADSGIVAESLVVRRMAEYPWEIANWQGR